VALHDDALRSTPAVDQMAGDLMPAAPAVGLLGMLRRQYTCTSIPLALKEPQFGKAKNPQGGYVRGAVSGWANLPTM
jgi:hypothetical protein